MDENCANVPSTSINSNSLIDPAMIKKESFDWEIKVKNDLKLIEMSGEYFVPTTNFKDDYTIIKNENSEHLETYDGIKVEEKSEAVFAESIDPKEGYSKETEYMNEPFYTFSQSESDGIEMKSESKSEILQEKKLYKSPLYDMNFSYLGIDMKNHVRSHKGEKPFQCSICSKCFKTKEHLKSHISTVHEGKKLFKCDSCGSSFTQKRSLDGHIKLVHEGIKTFLCEICNKAFGTNSAMKKHVSSVHEGKKPFKCERCGSSFTQKGSLDGHIKSVHEGIKRVQKSICDICNKAFATISDVKKHISSVHEGKKPFKCEHCGSCFTQKSSLNGHIRLVHEGIKTFLCDICNKAF